MRMTPEGEPTKEQRDTAILRDKDCYEKAQKRQELTFTIVEQDGTAAATILFWIQANLDTAPADKLREAFEAVLIMRSNRFGIEKKHAD